MTEEDDEEEDTEEDECIWTLSLSKAKEGRW